ncbi:isocitrate lyase/phosphoenolpyruvate mutase family protein [Sodalis glossinidius]|uniref:isocitrate lyase/phosphoenolpyruvate mutase family protein n=1 Tax=Sodalis glossinidius TaxID=63612 RepID=UPI00030FAA59|nr:isocitrate lyase/phosphoenolpyruvate mutase family protein [Sodalis glossinidius]
MRKSSRRRICDSTNSPAEAGFDGVCGSGFELAASYAVPDANILPMSMHLEMMSAIAAAVAAVVMKDKTFPKDTSLRAGGRQELGSIETFQGKIGAAIDARQDSNLVIIARVEALIAGLRQDDALRWAYAYQDASADAILIHSRQKTPAEILSFIDAWKGRIPLVLVPMAYPQLTESAIAESGKVGIVIYGNHAIRAAVGAMVASMVWKPPYRPSTIS